MMKFLSLEEKVLLRGTDGDKMGDNLQISKLKIKNLQK